MDKHSNCPYFKDAKVICREHDNYRCIGGRTDTTTTEYSCGCVNNWEHDDCPGFRDPDDDYRDEYNCDDCKMGVVKRG